MGNKRRTNFRFMYNKIEIEVVSCYKYLAVIVDEYLDFKDCTKTLADSSGRALCAMLSKVKHMKNIGYKSYTKLYNTCVVPVMDYGSEFWGYKFPCCETVQNRAVRFFLGLHKYVLTLVIQAEMGWFN